MSLPKGPLDPTQQLEVMAMIWGEQKGYVFLPWINGDCLTKDQRLNSYHEGRAYRWPADRDTILKHIEDHPSDDLYFTPGVFNGKRRIESALLPETCLWADLDPVDPRALRDLDLEPSIAWESSPGRYQGIWLFEDRVPHEGASKSGGYNHRLSLFVGADPSGWDSTQLLRVPGRPNFKPEYKGREEGNEGRLLWARPRKAFPDDAFEGLPEIRATYGDYQFEESLLESIDRREVWARVRLKVTKTVREYFGARAMGPDDDRSSILWQMARELADAGCSVPEIVALIRPTVWNKYEGRADELDRLKKEAAKAVAEIPEEVLEDLDGTPVDEEIHWLSEIAAKPLERPKWLVKDIWTRGGCGFIAGAPKSYKSWMALDLALSVATGTDFLNNPTFGAKDRQGQPVLYLQEEDAAQITMDRMATILEGKDLSLHYHGYMVPEKDENGKDIVVWNPAPTTPLAVHIQTGFIASDPKWQAWLDEMIAKYRFALVVIDTLGTTAGDVDTDKNSDLMGKLLKPMKQIAQEHGCAMCIVHHNKKDDSNGRAGRAMLGATALHAWVDCAIYARSKDENRVVTMERETKLAPDLQLRIQVPHMTEASKMLRVPERVLWWPEEYVARVDEEQPAGRDIPDDEPPKKYRKGDHKKSATLAKIEAAQATGEVIRWIGLPADMRQDVLDLQRRNIVTMADGLVRLVTDDMM